MKYLLLLGRGVEGCGVTKFAIEWEKWFKKNNYDYDILAVDDKRWSRKESHSFSKITKTSIRKDDEFEVAQKIVKDADVVILNSLPPVRSSKEIVLERFNQLIDLSKGKMAFIQHDHNNMSIVRNGCIEESCRAANVIFSHATKDSDFVRWLKKNDVIIDHEANSLFDEPSEAQDIPIINFQPGMYFEDVREKYWKPITEQDSYHHKWIGRTAPFKGYDLMFEFCQELMGRDFLITFEGLEQSPAIINVKQSYDFHNHFKDQIEDIDLKPYYNGLPALFSFYKNDELLERLSKCGFGYQLSRLDPRFLEHSIEYTHAEIVSVGCIPVFRKNYFDYCYHKQTGNPIAQDKDTGTVFIEKDGSNWNECYNLMEQLAKDDQMRDDWREMAYEYYKSHQSADGTFSSLMSNINRHIKKDS